MERDLWTKFKQLVTVSCGPGDNLSKTYIAELLSMLFLCKKNEQIVIFCKCEKDGRVPSVNLCFKAKASVPGTSNKLGE